MAASSARLAAHLAAGGMLDDVLMQCGPFLALAGSDQTELLQSARLLASGVLARLLHAATAAELGGSDLRAAHAWLSLLDVQLDTAAGEAAHQPALAAYGWHTVLDSVHAVAAALLRFWERQQGPSAAPLELAQAAATRSCAYLRCANLGGEGGPAAGQGVGSARCRWVGYGVVVVCHA